MWEYVQLKQFLISHLMRDADSHLARRYSEIGTGFDEVEVNLPDSDEEEFGKLFLARLFWEGWIDARNHGWAYYEHIEENEWPILAERIASALSQDVETAIRKCSLSLEVGLDGEGWARTRHGAT